VSRKNSKSGSAPKRQKSSKQPSVVTLEDHRKLMNAARDLERRLWASNVMLGATLRAVGGTHELPREHVVAMANASDPWEVRQELDQEAGVYRLTLVRHDGRLTEEQAHAAGAAVLAAQEAPGAPETAAPSEGAEA